VMNQHFTKNEHAVVEIRKEIEKSALVRQLKAQVYMMYDIFVFLVEKTT
jgi:hypothetical protein